MAELAALLSFWKILWPASSLCVSHSASFPFHHCGDFIWFAVFLFPDTHTEAASWWLADCVCLEIDRELTDTNTLGEWLCCSYLRICLCWYCSTGAGNVSSPFCFTISFMCVFLNTCNMLIYRSPSGYILGAEFANTRWMQALYGRHRVCICLHFMHLFNCFGIWVGFFEGGNFACIFGLHFKLNGCFLYRNGG